MASEAHRNGATPPRRARTIGPVRVEHRLENQDPILLARLDRCFGHHAELAPYDAHLRLTGRARGDVVLVVEATGMVIARRRLERPAKSRAVRTKRTPDPDPSPEGTSGEIGLRLPPSLRRRHRGGR